MGLVIALVFIVVATFRHSCRNVWVVAIVFVLALYNSCFGVIVTAIEVLSLCLVSIFAARSGF